MFRGNGSGYHKQNFQRLSRREQYEMNFGNVQNNNFPRSRSRSRSRPRNSQQGQNENVNRRNRLSSRSRLQQGQQRTNGRGNFSQNKHHSRLKFYNQGRGSSKNFCDFQGSTKNFYHNQYSKSGFQNNLSTQRYSYHEGYPNEFNQGQSHKNRWHDQQNFNNNHPDSRMDQTPPVMARMDQPPPLMARMDQPPPLMPRMDQPPPQIPRTDRPPPLMDQSPHQMMHINNSDEYFIPSNDRQGIQQSTSSFSSTSSSLRENGPEQQKGRGSSALGANAAQKKGDKKLWVIDEPVLEYIRANYPPDQHERVKNAFEQMNSMVVKKMTVYHCPICSIRCLTLENLKSHKKTEDHIEKRNSFFKQHWAEVTD